MKATSSYSSLFFTICCIVRLSTAAHVNIQNVNNGSLPISSHRASGLVVGHITFAGDNRVTLYVNGVQKLVSDNWSQFAYLSLSLKKGDVIGLKAKDFGVWYGVIAELVLNGVIKATGRDDWLATKGSDSGSLDWAKKDYSRSLLCTWRRPFVLPNERNWIPGKATYFNDPTAARYVWAHNAGVGDTIYLRHRVGGDKCKARSIITFAADNRAEVFVNGIQKGLSETWEDVYRITTKLSHGDVVALRVSDLGVWYGAIASIKTKTSEYISTGDNDVDWRAAKAFVIKGDQNAWMYPSYSACRWDKPVLRNPGVILPGKANDFPYAETGAEYVWASNAGVKDSIFLRTVIGVQC